MQLVRFGKRNALGAVQSAAQTTEPNIRFVACNSLHHLIEGPAMVAEFNFHTQPGSNSLGQSYVHSVEFAGRIAHEKWGHVMMIYGHNQFTPFDYPADIRGIVPTLAIPLKASIKRTIEVKYPACARALVILAG